MIDSRAMRAVFASGLAVFVGLLVAQPVMAAQGPPSATPVRDAQAELHLAADGYAVTVVGSGSKVELSVARGFSTAIYVTRGTVSPGAIRARFGHFGLISVRFRPSGRSRRSGPPRRCEGKPAIERRGVFAGTIRFRGEEGYISFSAQRAKGRSSTLPRWRCKSRNRAQASAGRQGGGLEIGELTASTPSKSTFLAALGIRDGKGPGLIVFFANAIERRGSVRISRLTFVFGDKGRSFAFEESGRAATLRPPKPFHGTATYDRDAPKGERWSGSLSVSLPGATVALTGPRFRVHLERKEVQRKKQNGDRDTATAQLAVDPPALFRHLAAP